MAFDVFAKYHQPTHWTYPVLALLLRSPVTRLILITLPWASGDTPAVLEALVGVATGAPALLVISVQASL